MKKHDTFGSQLLPNTAPLDIVGDLASDMVAGIDRFLLRKLAESVEERAIHWKRDNSSAENYELSIAPNRKRLMHIIGVRDARVPFDGLELIATTEQPALVGKGEGFDILAVRWPVLGDLHGEGLLLQPVGAEPVADIIAIPDADQTPEELVGIDEGVAGESQFPRRLVENGCRVVVPVLINREPAVNEIPNREYLYRSAFELGRHLIGYEVQKVLALVDWFERDALRCRRTGNDQTAIGVIGWGEGGMLALYAGALDNRLSAVCVSGYFDSRQSIWQGPIDRNVFGLLEQFGDAELASMIAPRKLIIEAARGPELEIRSGTGGAAPFVMTTPKLATVCQEAERALSLLADLPFAPRIELIVGDDGTGPYGSDQALLRFLMAIAPITALTALGTPPKNTRRSFDPNQRWNDQVHEIDRHNQLLLRRSPDARKQFFSRLDTNSVQGFEQSVEWYRRHFQNEVVGNFAEKPLPYNTRSRLWRDTPFWKGYEILMDVFPGVIAYGLLLVPKDLKDDEKRPVVVCQHGLEGRAQDAIEGDIEYYQNFAAKLAERGFITFSPQNPYIFGDRFRTLQRKANAIKKTLFSIIVPQHRQITGWLKTLSFVDESRIAFYGLSYGGKTAMRVPPLVKNYCLTICSADFNEWVWKNAATWSDYSYAKKGEYEIFEFDLGSTFNYAEMSWLICPRPFMVERGHFDGVGPDDWILYEYAKTQRHYDLLGLGDRTEIEVFDGPHTIHGVGTFDFLHRHLRWPKPKGA